MMQFTTSVASAANHFRPASSRRLRIAFVVHDYNRHGGHSRYVAELATRFRHDHEVHVFTNTVDDPDSSGITFHHVPAWRRNALTSILSFVVPATLAVRGRFDIIHAQGLCGFRHNVATAHFCQTAWFQALACENVGLSWRQQVFRRLVTGMERRALCQSATRRVIAISQRLRADVAELYGRTEGVDVIYHGTDTVTFHPDNRERYRTSVRGAAGIPDGRFVALYVGDLKKGALAAIQATAKTPGVTLLILSSSNPAPYQSAAGQVKVANRVIFLPHSKRVETFFAAADAFLFPTIYDPFGLVITEAMAAGLPVVTSRMAGASEVITPWVDGLVTERAWDVQAIAAHLERLRDDPRLRARLGSAARARIEPLSWDRTAEQTLAVYRGIAATDSLGQQL
jgi:UDP-glucose:(heptosyl)LPS alpha-1,3-glucosyltransferase